MVTLKQQILNEFNLFAVPTGGIGSWLTQETPDEIFTRLSTIDQEPLTAVQLNQLLILGHEAPVSDGCFRYYWLTAPKEHSYDVCLLPGFNKAWLSSHAVVSLDHLKWGLYRIYIDGF